MNKKRYSKFKYPDSECNKAQPTLRKCAKLCMDKNVSCPKENSDCKFWIDYKIDNNCSLCAIEKNSRHGLTLRETAERMGLSFVRIKQIEDAALKKIKNRQPQLFEYLIKDDF